ncbi:XRE family transcriptional regulator [Nocardioides sp. W7]|uniref:helix-turn-helix domain-containing protein n=1 Tax=Nocardioides sp. W7 TaxID=2931390 RepID=UPI001FD38D87|nr:XRE family transcriptional regulator [Nocardioides sp. W7]
MADEPSMEPEVAQLIGARVRELREARELSMRALAQAAGVSQPFLSQVERGASAPSMVTTYRLADALGVAPGDLLPAPRAEAATLVRAGEGARMPVADRPDSATGRALLFSDASALQVVEYVVEPAEWLSEWFVSTGRSGVYVVSGRLEVEIDGGATYTLGERDFLTFGDGVRERWRVLGAEPAYVLLSVAMPH